MREFKKDEESFGVSDSIYRSRDGEGGALSGLRVLDLTVARAGPTCVRQLSDMGAEVIRVSPPDGGFELGYSDSHNLHRGKRSVLIDLKKEDGRKVFLKLAEAADVLVENFRPAVKERLGIAYPEIALLNPRIIYASLSGFGQSGPYRDRSGVDQVIQGMSGLMGVTGRPDQEPLRTGIAISDSTAGTFLAQGILAALYVRERTGRGQWIHTSLLESMINFMDFQAIRWLVDGEVPKQAGNDHPTLFPMGTFATQDGFINLAVTTDWVAFVEVLGTPELLSDSRFTDSRSRSLNREPLRQKIETVLRKRSTTDWLRAFEKADVICGPILAVDEAFDDPQVDHLNLTREVTHVEAGEMSLLRHPVTFEASPTGISGPSPVPGADTRDVLIECGFDLTQIDDLIKQGVVRTES